MAGFTIQNEKQNLARVRGASLGHITPSKQGKASYSRSSPLSTTASPAAVAIHQHNDCLMTVSLGSGNFTLLGRQADHLVCYAGACEGQSTQAKFTQASCKRPNIAKNPACNYTHLLL